MQFQAVKQADFDDDVGAPRALTKGGKPSTGSLRVALVVN